MAKTVGYMRISTQKEQQKFDRQEDRLQEAGVSFIYSDRMSGSKRDRPQLVQMLDELETGDTVIIVSIDRLSRSTKDLLEIVELIKTKGAALKSLNDSWLDTSDDSPMGDFLLTVMGALAQMERGFIQQRVKEGMAVAKKKGQQFGRPKVNPTKVDHAIELVNAKKHTMKEIEQITGLSKATIYRRIAAQEQLPQSANK